MVEPSQIKPKLLNHNTDTDDDYYLDDIEDTLWTFIDYVTTFY